MKERLIQLMSDHTLTYDKMGEMLGYSGATVYYWVSGRSKPNIEAIKSICTTFGVSADWLLFGKE